MPDAIERLRRISRRGLSERWLEMRMCVNMRNRSTGRARLQEQATLIASRCCTRIRSVRSPWNGGGNGSGGESLSLAFQSSSAIDLTVLWICPHEDSIGAHEPLPPPRRANRLGRWRCL